MDLDLNLNNYKLTDLFKLFNISSDLTRDELKQAYKKTLMTHPDKSGLDKEYFLFFSKAYKKIKYIYSFRHRNDNCTRRKCSCCNLKPQYKNTNFIDEEDDYDHDQCDENRKNDTKKLFEKLSNKTDNDFNKIFNEMFEKVKIHDEEQDNGYDEWIKDNPVIEEDNNITNVRSLNEYINKKKQGLREITVYKGISEMNSSNDIGNVSNLMRKKPEYYESGLFSKFQYDDYKRAHTETVVPVTDEDFRNRRVFNSVNELMIERKNTEVVPTKEESLSILERRRKLEEIGSMEIAYDLSKQMEEIKKSKEIYNANFNLLLG